MIPPLLVLDRIYRSKNDDVANGVIISQ